MDYYVILGVSRTASAAIIRSAFRALVRQYHPDVGVGSSEQRFRQIVEAYETLSDPERRRRYDASLQPSAPPRVIEPLAPDWPETLLGQRGPRFSRVITIRPREPFAFDDLFRSLERLFWDF